MDFSASDWAYKMSISWHKTSKTQHFMNHWCFGSWKPAFLHFIRPEYFNEIKKNQGTSLEKMGKYFSRNSETQEFPNFGNLRCPPFWKIEILNSWIFANQKWLILENDEKSKTRNLLTLILPAESLQNLEYEFSFDQKTWIVFP